MYLDTNPRRQLFSNDYKAVGYNTDLVNLKKGQNLLIDRNEHLGIKGNHGSYGGILIEGTKPISGIKLFANRLLFREFDLTLLDICREGLPENCYWIPFDGLKDWKSTTLAGSARISAFESFTIDIETDNSFTGTAYLRGQVGILYGDTNATVVADVNKEENSLNKVGFFQNLAKLFRLS